MENNSTPKITRVPHLAENIVFIDGLEGCGKTLFSSLVSSFERVEKLNYCYEIEHICSLDYLNKVDKSVSKSLIRMWTDLLLYNSMMARDVNFRITDLSSAFKYHDKTEYLKRLFYRGDENVPKLVKKRKPILSITVHKLISRSSAVFEALGNRFKFIEIVRHPLYMIIQQSLNNQNMIDSVRDFTKLAFELVDLDYKKFVKVEKKLYRPSEVESLLGDCKKAKKNLKWRPKFDFKKLVKDMVKADLEFVEKEGY